MYINEIYLSIYVNEIMFSKLDIELELLVLVIIKAFLNKIK